MNTAHSMTEPQTLPTHSASNGGRLVTTDGRTLPLTGASLHTEARGGVARVVLEQRFENPHAEPLAVTYSLPLPADGAVSGFAFRIGERRIQGEIDGRKVARERYEQALAEGRSAALLEQDRSSLFTQEIGNIPPGETVVAEVIIEQRLRWLDEGAWEWRFPTVVAPRYLGDSGRVPDAARITQDIAAGPLAVQIELSCVVRDALARGRAPESPSHPLRVSGEPGALRVAFASEDGARLDRDVVVRWAVGAAKVGLSIDLGRPLADRASAGHSYGLLTVVPPAANTPARAVCRDLIVLLDTSGSMAGEPLSQARRVISALIETLRDDDQLELIEFSNRARRWKPGPVAATLGARRDAFDWLAKLRASGSTEMRDGILEAMHALRAESQRQVVLITDGMIGFETEVVAAICDRLPASSRLHTVGVGSAVNRSLTGPASRAGRGIEVVIGLGEDPERAAARLVARTRHPILVELELSGPTLVSHSPHRLPDLFAGAPALIGVALRPEGGELCVRGRTAEGTWMQRIDIAPVRTGSGNPAAVTLFGREAVEDLELRLAAGGNAHEINATIQRLGIDFQIATRLTSWIAVSQDVTVDPQDPLRRETMPHALAHGLSAEGVGLRPAMAQIAMGRVGMAEIERSAGATPPGFAPALGAPAPRSIAAPAPFADGMDDDAPEEAPMAKSRALREGGGMDRGADRSKASPDMKPRPAGAPAPRQQKMEETRQPPMRPLEAEKPKGGLLGAIKRLLVGEKPSAWDEGAASPSPAKTPPLAMRTLVGRIVLQKGDELILEVEVTGEAFDWDPACHVEIRLDDGRSLRMGVLAARSTRAGQLAPGMSLRVCIPLAVGTKVAAIRTLFLHQDGKASIIVTL